MEIACKSFSICEFVCEVDVSLSPLKGVKGLEKYKSHFAKMN